MGKKVISLKRDSVPHLWWRQKCLMAIAMIIQPMSGHSAASSTRCLQATHRSLALVNKTFSKISPEVPITSLKHANSRLWVFRSSTHVSNTTTARDQLWTSSSITHILPWTTPWSRAQNKIYSYLIIRNRESSYLRTTLITLWATTSLLRGRLAMETRIWPTRNF